MAVIRGFGSMKLCKLAIHFRYFSSNPLFFIPVSYNSYLPKTSFCNPICKVFGLRATAGGIYEVRRYQISRPLFIHSSSFSKTTENVVEHAGEEAVVSEGSRDEKVKRKKLKGRQAVVKWVKFFRWKKKKEYERMTDEEKILYKLRKARKKEERMVEALRKIEPKDISELKHDPEILTPEEHFYFLKMGQKSKNYVPVGRRGIYQGVILNMHLHWKKHQTLQVIVKTFTPDEVKEIAVELARLSGGIVLDIQEENTIIMYRGKNYVQPPTEIMSPRITLPRKKALDKSKYRDALRAVRKYIPRLQQDLELLKARAENQPELESFDKDSQVTEPSDKITEILAVTEENGEDESDELNMDSDSEDLSDIFESDSELDKEEKPLYLKEFEKFPVQNYGEDEDFDEHLQNGKYEKDDELPDLNEVDRMVMKAASMLRKKRR